MPGLWVRASPGAKWFYRRDVSLKIFWIDHDRTRTCNPQIRSLVPYPLGHMVLVLAATKFDWVCKCIFHACVQSDKLELKYSQLVGFEPTLPKGNSFRVSRLNHSATTAHTVVACIQNTVWSILEFVSLKLCWHRWFSGRMLACHAGGPGSIPGRCIFFFSKMFCPPYLNRIDVVKFSNFKVPHDSL